MVNLIGITMIAGYIQVAQKINQLSYLQNQALTQMFRRNVREYQRIVTQLHHLQQIGHLELTIKETSLT